MGYIGFSMSERAYDAYENGRMPKSKWTKQAMLEALENGGMEKSSLEIAKKMTVTALRNAVLRKTEWHHTSMYYNETEFYDVDCSADLSFVNLQCGSKKKQEDEVTIRKCTFLVWEGTRKHPKAVKHTEVCEVKGNWATTTYGKKSIRANGFRFED